MKQKQVIDQLIIDQLKNILGKSLIRIKPYSPNIYDVYVRESEELFFKWCFKGDKGNIISVHDGKVVVFIEPVVENSYCLCKLVEFDRYYLGRPLPTNINGITIKYKKDLWGW